MKSEKAIFIRGFKTKRADGHVVKTIYSLADRGFVNIERRIVSTELNEGFRHIRTFGKYIYQRESMIFKLDSFAQIARDVQQNVHKISKENIIRKDDVLFSHNEKEIIRLYI